MPTTTTYFRAIDYAREMKRALSLAERGRGRTGTNPLVGAVLLTPAGEVIATGFHARVGEAHAEAVALARAGARARGATLVVNLEPCCHRGRTGPCTRAIIDAGVRRVIIAHRDPDLRVNGGGLEELRRAGIEIVEGIETAPAKRLNEHYLTVRCEGRAFVTLKLALSLDGFTADAEGRSRWLTGPACRAHAHRERARHDAVLVGAGTARSDDPALTARTAAGPQPRRFVLVGREGLPPGLRLFVGPHPAVRIGTDASRADWVLPAGADGYPEPGAILRHLVSEGCASVLVEGGARVAAAFLRAGLVDRLVLYYGPLLLGSGRGAFADWSAPLAGAPALRAGEVEALGDGLVVSGYPER